MKIGVVSDNHFDEHILNLILERESDVSLWIHCGDSQMDINDDLMKHFICVRGNTDYSPFSAEQLVGIPETNILVSHGHLYNIDFSTEEIVTSAQIQKAGLVLHGHTHVPRDIVCDGVRIINPGSTSWPRGGFASGSYALIEVIGDVRSWRVTFVNAKTGEPMTCQ